MTSMLLKSLVGAFLAVNSFTLIDGAMTGYKLEPSCDASQINSPDSPYALKGTYKQAVQFGQSIGLSKDKADKLGDATRNLLFYPGMPGEILGGITGAATRSTLSPRRDCYVSVIG